MDAISDGDTPQTFADLPASAWSTPAADAPDTPPVSEPTVPDDASASPPASAPTSPPSPPGTGEQPREQRGPIPYDRHEAVLNTERQKREALEAKWQQVAWAENLVSRGASPEQVLHAFSHYSEAQTNPIGFLERLLTEAAGRPDLISQVRSIAGRVLGSNGNGQAPSPEDTEPQPDYVGPDGVPFFSAPQLQKWRAWDTRQRNAELEQRLEPFERERQQREAQAEHQRLYRSHYDEGAKQLEAIKQLPYVKENYEAIRQKVAAHMEATHYAGSLESAFLHVLTEMMPTLTQTGRSNAIAELRTQAAASSVSPRGGAASVPASPKTFFDPSLKW